MFDFLKRKKFIERNKSIELALNSFSLLSPKYDYIIKQLNDGIIVSEKIDNSVFTNYISFSFDIKLLNKYENKNGDYFMIKGIKFYDINEHIFLDICFYIGYGILLGYSTPQAKKIYPDVQKIDVEAHYLELFPNRDYDIVKTLFTKEELLFISSNDVYEVEFEGNKLYHIKDLEDGDFIAIDLEKKIYKITHDPMEIVSLTVGLEDILKHY